MVGNDTEGEGAGGADEGVPRVASELRNPLPNPEVGGDVPSVASELRKPPCGSAGTGGGCDDDHDEGSTPKVSGREPGSIGGGHEGIGDGELLGGGLNNGKFGGSHAIAPMRLAGISDMKAVRGSGGAAELAALGCAPDGTSPALGVADCGGTNQSSGPSEGGGSGNSLGWTTMCGSARMRAHCAGSVGSNGSSGSNGIGSPACAGGENEKSSRDGEPLFGW